MHDVMWPTIVGNTLTAVSYFVIPYFMCAFFIRRKDLPFSGMWLLFGAFIASCGIGHALHVAAIYWHGLHAFAEYWRLVTATVSIATAYKLPSILRFAMLIPSPEQLEKINAELADALRNHMK